MQGHGQAPDGPERQGHPAHPLRRPESSLRRREARFRCRAGRCLLRAAGVRGASSSSGKKPSPLVWVVIGLAAIFFVGATGFMLIQGGGPSGPVKAEQCVDKGFGLDDGSRIPASIRVSCDDAEAKAKVVKITDEREASGFSMTSRSEPDCPAGTHGVTNVRGKETDKHYYEACVRNIRARTPATPARAARSWPPYDCVSSGSIGFGKEQPCAKSGWYGKVVARVATEQSCPAQTLEVMKMRSFGGGELAKPVVCLGPGGGVLATGDCIEDPRSTSATSTRPTAAPPRPSPRWSAASRRSRSARPRPRTT